MKRIAVTGSPQSGTWFIANALAAMTGFDVASRPAYSLLASKYRLNADHGKCQWPGSFVYCLGAFTERVMVEQGYENRFVSDGSVLHELVWLECRFPHHELVYEQSMINSLEQVVAEYASARYDYIFHIGSPDVPGPFDQCIGRICDRYNIRFQQMNGIGPETTLERIVDDISVKPVLSAKNSLLKAGEYRPEENGFPGEPKNPKNTFPVL